MSDILMHHGVKGQTWGVRRYQNEDGSRTDIGKQHENALKRSNRAVTYGPFSGMPSNRAVNANRIPSNIAVNANRIPSNIAVNANRMQSNNANRIPSNRAVNANRMPSNRAVNANRKQSNNAVYGVIKKEDPDSIPAEEEYDTVRPSKSKSSTVGISTRKKSTTGAIKNGSLVTAKILKSSEIAKPLRSNRNSSIINKGKKIAILQLKKSIP